MRRILPFLTLLAACRPESGATLQDTAASPAVAQSAQAPQPEPPTVVAAARVPFALDTSSGVDTVLVGGAVLDGPSVPWNQYPRVRVNDCSGESCGIRFPAVACADVQLRTAPTDSAPLDVIVARYDTVTVRQTDMHLEAPGVVVFRKAWADDKEDTDDGWVPASDTFHFAAGDTLYLQHYIGLGSWQAIVHGKLQRISGGWWFFHDVLALGSSSRDSSIAVARSLPAVSTWWHVSLSDGRRGFWKFDNDNWRTGLKPDGKYWEFDCSGNG